MHHFRLEMQKNQRSCLQIVHVNNATAFSSTSVRVEDKHEFAKTVEASKVYDLRSSTSMRFARVL